MIAIAPQLDAAWQLIDVRNLKGTLPKFKLAIAGITTKYGQASRTLAAQFYRQQRAAAGVAGHVSILPGDLANLDQVDSSIGWATQPLWGSESDIATARTNVEGVTDNLVLNAGRDTIVDTAREDKKARGWARIPEPGACYFCALLATRGAVYKEDTVDFEAHNHCRCHAEPVFTAYEPSAQIREWTSLYHSGPPNLNAFRQAYEAHTAG